MTISASEYRAALRRHPAGVAVITLMAPTGPVGFTATSFASVSLTPPLVSFNITDTSSSIDALREATSVVVHLLGASQLPVAQRFSRSAEERFADRSTWTIIDSGEPVLVGATTWLRAEIDRLIPAGDSTLAIAGVKQIHCDATTPGPLIYHDGGYHRAVPID
ncbi:flavin oxidoreductase [Mycolicibacterium insubricum]|uniref:Flavin oxidoreductase n=1 Tax=Mycolicibacterium insubricum TaxID=444597 RepID=A0A1X0D4G3_9MYCO|nr:flavin reductase family protein [Mycolicibacterium insubricum]MCB9440968.1 flavin reductase family protein [Mycolicibacterium sp.]MCV7080025.1 flavin reductase family protein [Mycolicibacterium insubricum]ORA67119.1 flavin oxidoreductase [Mycolicibacterium insubricum]BBZ65981.1 flavin oxidoreductase [Mycolicibacterium insubricum]